MRWQSPQRLLEVTHNFLFFLVTSRAIYPDLSRPEPSAPPLPDDTLNPRKGMVRARSDSPFNRSVKPKVDYSPEDLENISCLLDFSMRDVRTKRTVTLAPISSPEVVTVKTFSTMPRTPAAAPRPEQPPRIPRPRALLQTTLSTKRPPSAALGVPPREEDDELPEIPSPQTVTFLYIGI